MKGILIVDDQPLILTALEKALSGPGLEVVTFESSSDALVEIESTFYHLCFLDINIADQCGLKLMKRIKEVSPESQVVIMSSCALTDDMEREIEEHALLFIPKPFEMFHMKMIVKHLFEDIGNSLHGNGLPLPQVRRKERRFHRRPARESVNYLLDPGGSEGAVMAHVRAETINISDGGVCLMTDHFLEPGQVINFTEGVEREKGVVRWSSPAEESYRVGVEFC
jgi:DNA-binding response OmpR family regulator